MPLIDRYTSKNGEWNKWSLASTWPHPADPLTAAKDVTCQSMMDRPGLEPDTGHYICPIRFISPCHHVSRMALQVDCIDA
jgi:hypothetical protein